MRKLITIIFLVSILFPAAASASIYGILKGKVMTEDGGPAAGASVRIEGTTKGALVKQDGSFTIVNINAGTYTVKITSVGYAEHKENVKISPDKTTKINVVLESEVKETDEIVVTADQEMVRNDEVGSMSTISTDDVEQIGGGIQALVGITAGVSSGGDGWNIRGSRTSETQIRVDGLDFSNQFTGGIGRAGTGYAPLVSSYATEETQVITGSFSAEYGNTMGGVVNTVVKRGRTDRYEGFLRYEDAVPFLYGTHNERLKLVREEGKNNLIHVNDGFDYEATDEYKVEFGTGGPLPLLANSTFYISGNYSARSTGNYFSHFDPWGNDIGKETGTEIWSKNLTGRMTYSLTPEIKLILGGQYGMTNWFGTGWAWLYANDSGVFYDTTANGEVNSYSNGVPERLMKQNASNQILANYFMRINHQLSTSSFYELTVSTQINNDDAGRRPDLHDPNFVTGYDFIYPQDKFRVSDFKLVPGFNRIVDHYELILKNQKSADGYQYGAFPVRNPLTGYYEGQTNTSGSNNPYGFDQFFVTHGSGGFQYRRQYSYNVDGSYFNNFQTEEFDHKFKTGFEFQYTELLRHYNGNPYSANPFHDIYTDQWGGNIYLKDSAEIYNRTSKPFTPYRFAAYAQDQIEYKGIVFTPGLRFDFFEPDSRYRLPSQNFLSIAADSGFAEAETKIQLSPRIYVAYPLTERSNISISYGMFFQIPPLQYLYDNFNKTESRGNAILGHPDMDAQRTNQYEVAYRNQLTDDFMLAIKAYYKDIYNQVGLEYVPAVPDPFFQYTVAEYGFSKGIEFEFRKRTTDHIGFNINYTLAQAEGTSTSPTSNYLRPLDPYTDIPAIPLDSYPLGYDIRHRINFIMNFNWANNEGPSIGGIQVLENMNFNARVTFRSGSPYTRRDLAGNPITEFNAERQPSVWSNNLRVIKKFWLRDIFGESMGNSAIDLILDFYNLVNSTAVTGVYSRTNDPDDDGVWLQRTKGTITNSITYYDEPNFAIVETTRPEQYDFYGGRKYSPDADYDGNGSVTQDEKYQSYLEITEDLFETMNNYRNPRTVFFSILFRF